ncbi:hypothetical protein [Bacillus sp. NPDC094106]|uniref:hypothetical protein n=1 Tax=Bacillus sp. NPDC094106 TaxID=3363949 RepID=UPI003814A288
MNKVYVTVEERKLLERYLHIMNNRQLHIGQRRLAKMRFDMIYERAKRKSE